MFSLATLLVLIVSACCISANENSTDSRNTRQAYYNPYWQGTRQYDLWKPAYLPESHLPPFNPYFKDPRLFYRDPYTLGSTIQASSPDSPATFRQNFFGLSSINSAISPITSFLARLPDTLTYNPNSVDTFTNNYEPCVDSLDGFSGICVRPLVCRSFRGRSGDSCGFGTVCCVNIIAKCGANVTVNNTYWQSPAIVSARTTCGVNLTLDNNLVEQRKKICQVRLDFVSFSISQPSSSSVCDTDTFKVSGTSNKVPVICGDSTGQHMYLNVPSFFTSLQLLFTFGFGSTPARAWNIRIAYLPCGTNYLAPSDCLQYFTGVSGTVSSFNWGDTSVTATRQLADQDYKMCFRTELIGNLISSKICYSPCAVSNQGTYFSVSGTEAKSQNSFDDCKSDYLIIEGGFDSNSLSDTWDRYCGGNFNPQEGQTLPVTVCTTVKPFSLTYRTNGNEDESSGSSTSSTVATTTTAITTTYAPPFRYFESSIARSSVTTGNIGFCFTFKQSF